MRMGGRTQRKEWKSLATILVRKRIQLRSVLADTGNQFDWKEAAIFLSRNPIGKQQQARKAYGTGDGKWA